jgi:hypothetical protein
VKAVPLTKTRDLLRKGVRKNCCLLASIIPCPYETVIIKYEDGKEEKTTVSYNALPVKLPGRENSLFLVVVKGFGKEPMPTGCIISSFQTKPVSRMSRSQKRPTFSSPSASGRSER